MHPYSSGQPSATETKERLYAQLAGSLGRMTRAMSQTADLCEQLQFDLHAMKVFAGLDAAKYIFALLLMIEGFSC
jgi:hypothetical protein